MKSSFAGVTSAAEGLPRRRFTVAEVEAMVAARVMEEDERVELIGGELVPMSPKGIDRDRGTPRDATPPTPPGIRVRTTAVRPS
jgi:hypothetical protein